jgi:hypothetical protein
MKTLVLIALGLVFANALRIKVNEDYYMSRFLDFIQKFSKEYDDKEFSVRYEVFKKNVDFINAHNNKKPTPSFTGKKRNIDLLKFQLESISLQILHWKSSRHNIYDSNRRIFTLKAHTMIFRSIFPIESIGMISTL